MIAERLNKTSEWIELPPELSDLRVFFLDHYPELNELSFALAINQEMREVAVEGEVLHEIALLPPFAGG